jgi:soluble lytic murein transglycosylase-like protein
LSKRAALLTAAIAGAVVVLLALVAIVLSRQRVQRHPVFRAVPRPAAAPKPVAELRGVEEWSSQFRGLAASGRWSDLHEVLGQVAKAHPDLYAKWQLAYLDARALIEDNQPKEATAALAPFLAPGHPLRDLALFHQAEIEEARDEPAAASRFRTQLIVEAPASLYRSQTIDDEIAYRAALKDPRPLADLAARLYPSADTKRRRDLDSHLAEAALRAGDANGALARGLAILRGGTMDDAAERASRALDRPELLKRMNAAQLATMGDAMKNHRHFDRAVAIYQMVLPRNPVGAQAPPPVHAGMLAVKKAKPKGGQARAPVPHGKPGKAKPAAHPVGAQAPPPVPTPARTPDDLTFDLGRAYFGNEQFAEAQRTYLRGAAATRDAKWKATFLFHASRAAQLQGDDAGAEKLMTAVLAVPGRLPAHAAALTQRLRTRLRQKRINEAAADLNAVRAQFPNDHALVEASLAWAVGMVGLGNNGAALAALNAVPGRLLDKFEPYEVDYWRARAQENSNPPAAFAAYLNVLRAAQPTHFAYFARQRLDAPSMAPKLAQELASREAEAQKQMAAGQWEVARRIETDRILLSSRDRARELAKLKTIFAHLPAYGAIVELKPQAMPAFPLPDNAERGALLMAMGLYDEAADAIPHRWPLRPLSSALTQSVALNRGNASRESIYAIEVLMNGVPRDFVPDLLPLSVRELLYPRYFYDSITEDAKKYDADPTLLLSIMREESRFNPRAKSEAAARGLLQFIITTARDIGRQVGLVDVTADDLYDPRIIIRLGAKYVSELAGSLGGDRYKIAAAYNAGPKQVALWSRLAPGSGEDFFLSSINFDETKQYVRKVMNSYQRYAEIYGGAGPQGGVRVEP